MCATCGCDDTEGVRIEGVAEGHDHHDHADGHHHSHAADHAVETITLEQDVLAKNDRLAARNREWLADHGIRAVNLMSSPGAGKTTLLERTVRELAVDVPVAVIEGDQDLLPYVPFDQERFTEHLRRVNPDAELLPVSAVSGANLGDWHGWLRAGLGVQQPAVSG